MLRLSLLLLALATPLYAQVERIEPPFWWAEMPVEELQIQLYGENLGGYRAQIDHPGVSIVRQIAVDSRNYLFLYLNIAPDTKAGNIDIVLSDGKDERHTISYELKRRSPQANRNQGFDSTDTIYLLMPDRFANGDPTNDSIAGMLETADRSDPTKRQGGDLKGIHDRLDYIQDLGMTAIWFTPIFENDMSPDYGAYHGYAATDLYRVDRRFGSNEEYRALIAELHDRGMKVIMDMIHNHIGIEHWWMSDLPTKDWLHDFETYGQTNFQGDTPADPYASQFDKDKLVKGWFVPEMPDLDQRNELLADYLIQNTLWWIEYSGIDGIRMDTYLYPYPEYMARWVEEVLQAYPNFNIVGEAWVNTVAHEAYWQYDLPGSSDGYDSKLPSVTDFPLSFAIRDALIEAPSGSTGLMRLYRTLAQDSLYTDPNQNVIFLDNHDMTRVFEHLEKDPQLFKIAYAILMTMRGIPQVYYGTELMMGHENRGGDDEAWRQTMPGGWNGDERNVFSSKGRSAQEKDALEYISNLTKWRSGTPAAHAGKFIHFIPRDNTYVYFRVLDEGAVMVAVNLNEEEIILDSKRYSEVLSRFVSAYDPIAKRKRNTNSPFAIDGKSAAVFDLK